MGANLVAVVFTVIFTRALGAGRLRLARRAAQPDRDPLRPRLRAAGRRGARGDARAARPRRRARRARSSAGAATSCSRWWPSPSCPSVAREPLARADQRRAGVGGGRGARDRGAVAAAVPAARAAAVGPRLPRGRAERAARGARAPRRWRSCSSPPGSASPAPTSARWPRSPSPRPRSRGCTRRRLGPPDLAQPPAPAAGARPRRGAADRRAHARRRAPERRRDHGQARAHRDRRRRLRGDDGGREGGGLDRRRPRLLGAARRPPAAPPPAATRAPCWRARSASSPRSSAAALVIFAAVPELLLRTAFGADYESGADVLLMLGAAYALLASQLPLRPVPARPAPARGHARARGHGRWPSRCCCSAPATSRRSPAPCCSCTR